MKGYYVPDTVLRVQQRTGSAQSCPHACSLLLCPVLHLALHTCLPYLHPAYLVYICYLLLQLSSSPPTLDCKQLEGRGEIFNFESFAIPNTLGSQQMFLGQNTKLKTKFTSDAKHLSFAYIHPCVPKTSVY